MIGIGLDTEAKAELVAQRLDGVEKVVVFYPKRHPLPLSLDVPVEHVEWDDIIRYVYFYRLLQEITPSTLLVFNEMLRTTERSCLHYNCLRNYQTRTTRAVVFSRFAVLESPDDSMILVDFATRSRWRRAKLADVDECVSLQAQDVSPRLVPIAVETNAKTRALYTQSKRDLIAGIGGKDPHTIPRQLHLIGGKHKAREASQRGGLWVGRNARLKVPGLATYDEASEPRQVLEFCHSFRDWSDYLTASGSTEVPALVSDLRVDQWYLERFTRWSEMQHDAIAALRDKFGS